MNNEDNTTNFLIQITFDKWCALSTVHYMQRFANILPIIKWEMDKLKSQIHVLYKNAAWENTHNLITGKCAYGQSFFR